MKKYYILLLSLIALICFCSCSKSPNTNIESPNSTDSLVNNTSELRSYISDEDIIGIAKITGKTEAEVKEVLDTPVYVNPEVLDNIADEIFSEYTSDTSEYSDTPINELPRQLWVII